VTCSALADVLDMAGEVDCIWGFDAIAVDVSVRKWRWIRLMCRDVCVACADGGVALDGLVSGLPVSSATEAHRGESDILLLIEMKMV
jgi:hypothetical protein